MKNVLLTGATGFIGSHLVKELMQQQVMLRVLVRTMKVFPPGIEVFHGDLIHKTSLVYACENIDTVFHLAGLAHTQNTKLTEQLTVNFEGTKNLLEVAVDEGVKRFIYFSSVKAGDASPYGKAKKEAEDLLLTVGQEAGLHVCVLRPALVYGPNWKGNLDAMLRAVDKGLFPPLPETHNIRSLVSVPDVCQAAILAAQNPNSNGKVYTISDGCAYSTREIYENMVLALNKKIPKWSIPVFVFKLVAHCGDLLEKIGKRRLPINSEMVEKLLGSAYYPSSEIQHDLAFKPRYDLTSLLPEIVSVYKGT